MKAAALLLVVACGVSVPVVPEASRSTMSDVQACVSGVTQAIVANDAAALGALWMPERYQELGTRGVQLFIDRTRVGLMGFYGDQPPAVIDVAEGYDGSLEATISDAARTFTSPKQVFLWRDPTLGKVYFAGTSPARQSAASFAAAPINVQMQQFDIWNQSANTTHHMFLSWDTVDPDYPSMPNCTGWGSGGYCGHVTAHQYPGGWYGNQFWNVNVYGNQWADRLVSNNIPCDSTSRCASTSSCCWSNPWGWDFWWGQSDTDTTSWPFCSVSACPP